MTEHAEQNLLLEQPTVQLWHDELRLLLCGKRDYLVRHLGSAEEYVERQLRDSLDPEDADSAFGAALNAEVTAWQVGRRRTPYYLKSILQLICAFTPPAGFAKAIEMIERRLDGLEEFDTELCFVAVAALARYYRTTPPNAQTDAAFGNYVNLLDRLLSDIELAPMAVRYLLELGAVKLSDRKFAASIVSDDAKLSAAVEYAVRPPAAWSGYHLSALLNACLRYGDKRPFEQYFKNLEGYNAPVILEEDHILVVPADGQKVFIRPDRDLCDLYATLKWDLTYELGLKRLEDLYAAA